MLFASPRRDCRFWDLDVAETTLAIGRAKADDRGIAVEFAAADAFRPERWGAGLRRCWTATVSRLRRRRAQWTNGRQRRLPVPPIWDLVVRRRSEHLAPVALARLAYQSQPSVTYNSASTSDAAFMPLPYSAITSAIRRAL
jgi:hypothetical protein